MPVKFADRQFSQIRNRYPLMKQSHSLLFAVVAAVAFGAGVYLNQYQQADEVAASVPDIPGFLWPKPRALTPFKLTDDSGNTFNLDRLKGRWSFLFFGYTHCPDVCPNTLAVMAQVKKRVDATHAATPSQYVFVSLDPERDTPAVLKQYVHYFDPAFIGATDSEAYLKSITMQLGVAYFKSKPADNGKYDVDHSTSIMLIDPQGRWVGNFKAPHKADEVFDNFAKMRAVIGAG